jgi:hypothetical protein
MDPEVLKQAAKSAGMDMPDIDPEMMAKVCHLFSSSRVQSRQQYECRVARVGVDFLRVLNVPVIVNACGKLQAAEQMGNLSPEQMQKMMKYANHAQTCMSVCAKPIAVVKWCIGWIPAQFRRSVYMGLAAVLVYWLFMGGASSGGPAPTPFRHPDLGDEFSGTCESHPCQNDANCIELADA